MYGGSGMAQNRGAWGYFAGSRDLLKEEDILKERYYVAVQTFLTEKWRTNTSEAVKWFKHRKVIVINPETGQSVVAVVADSGPATWTGKQYGCSPEAIHYLGLAHGSRRGAVLMFFVDDPENKVPLGPLSG
ncbi:MAG: hypothetical protein A2Y57_03280 [Candidatus Woykebacteria bacterium RBG_13_40_7b]|uniref:Uncharacterized protein n=1 Tax=Candidatus Woykebacteria bacterium RBG_13_40_7b TaxID=1802594 RepID=A0A1G1WA13_9BACT|nr:MAG: hypothetical protein A2Y57_03280 [Candidatus Woykebacteria bacterium RBG_13_40_7b]